MFLDPGSVYFVRHGQVSLCRVSDLPSLIATCPGEGFHNLPDAAQASESVLFDAALAPGCRGTGEQESGVVSPPAAWRTEEGKKECRKLHEFTQMMGPIDQ